MLLVLHDLLVLYKRVEELLKRRHALRDERLLLGSESFLGRELRKLIENVNTEGFLDH